MTLHFSRRSEWVVADSEGLAFTCSHTTAQYDTACCVDPCTQLNFFTNFTLCANCASWVAWVCVLHRRCKHHSSRRLFHHLEVQGLTHQSRAYLNQPWLQSLINDDVISIQLKAMAVVDHDILAGLQKHTFVWHIHCGQVDEQT